MRPEVAGSASVAGIAEGLEAEFTRQLALHKPLGSDEAAALKAEQARIEAARRGIVNSIKDNPAAVALMAPEIERLAADAEALKRKQKQAKPTLDKAAIKEMVERGVKFFEERVLGPMAASAPKTDTTGKGTAEADASGEGERADAEPKQQAGRPCTAELKEVLRLLDTKLTYDPDGKEGALTFDPFVQHAAG
jgi:hypothetical protein